MLTSNPIFPTTLVKRDSRRLISELKKEHIAFGGLLGSVSGEVGGELIAWVWGWGIDKEDDNEVEFEATWRFDDAMISSPTNQFYLDEVEIYEH